MNERCINRAAQCLLNCWETGQVIAALEPDCLPTTVAHGYAIAAAIAEQREQAVAGWKIAATAPAGRAHINVDQPLAGRLFEPSVRQNGARLNLQNNRMAVAEAEFVFTMGTDLTPQSSPFTEEQVARAISHLHPGLEIPDARFSDFTKVGAACLIADNACASQFVLGLPTVEPFEPQALAEHASSLWINDVEVTSGHGSDALGGPLKALTWLANTLRELGLPLVAGQFVTTGVTGQPMPIKAGDRVRASLGRFGTVNASVHSGADYDLL